MFSMGDYNECMHNFNDENRFHQLIDIQSLNLSASP